MTNGTIRLLEGEWRVTAPPHVMIRLKGVFGRLNAREFGTVRILNTDEVCCDLDWFLQRYPMENENTLELAAGAERYRQQQRELECFILPGYRPQVFEMALPARDYQARAAEMFLKRGSQLLADQLGLGKSVTALAALTDKRLRPALVVVQSHLPGQWRFYANRFLPAAKVHIIKSSKHYQLPPADIYIITYHKLSGWAEVLSKVVKSLVFDEVQELRHDNTAKYFAARHLRAHVSHAMGLSATPIYNYGGEIFNVMEILAPGSIGTRPEFEREWCSSWGRHALLKDPDAFGSYLRAQFLMLRRTRKEVGRELPAVTTTVETIEHDAKVLDNLDAVATELAHRILQRETSFEEKGMAAREFDMKMRQATGLSKAPFVAAFVQMLVGMGEQVVLTGWHRDVYDVWSKRILAPKSFFTGTESPTQKLREVERFVKGESRVFIMSLRSGAGLDGLQEVCSTIVHGELDWSPGVHEQCRGRIFRDGQRNGVMEYFLVSDGGSDPVVSDVLGLKKAQVRGLLEPGGSGLDLQADAGARVKHLAQEYLRRKGFAA
jgi:SNF2 family DNA or RNA helicase